MRVVGHKKNAQAVICVVPIFRSWQRFCCCSDSLFVSHALSSCKKAGVRTPTWTKAWQEVAIFVFLNKTAFLSSRHVSITAFDWFFVLIKTGMSHFVSIGDVWVSFCVTIYSNSFLYCFVASLMLASVNDLTPFMNKWKRFDLFWRVIHFFYASVFLKQFEWSMFWLVYWHRNQLISTFYAPLCLFYARWLRGERQRGLCNCPIRWCKWNRLSRRVFPASV